MKLEIIGGGSAFAKDRTNTSLILWQKDGAGILLDCGYNVYPRLQDLGYIDKIKAVLLSHTHQDHCGSAVTLLEDIYAKRHLPLIIGGVSWKKLLQLCEGDGAEEKIRLSDGECELETFAVPHAKGMECVALFVENKVLYSGDTAVSILDTPQAAAAQIIIHDTALRPGLIHVYIKELAQAPLDIKKKTYLIHYLPQDYEKLCLLAKEHGFGGVAKAGDIFEID